MTLVISEAEYQESLRRTNAWCDAMALPNGWIEHPIPIETLRRHPELAGQRCYDHRDGRHVVVTVGAHESDGWWLHVSVSRRAYVPSYDDLAEVKRVFVGDDVQAVQVFPRRERHVNIMPTCLHLWARLDASDGLPDFGKEGTI
jgi:hypothetical protein